MKNKNVTLIMQSKGGVGKSFLTWFIAQIEKENKAVYFIDVDSETQTSKTRIPGIVGEERIGLYKILNDNKKLDREQLINLFELISKTKIPEDYYLDFGASESREFKSLLEFDFPAEIFVDAIKELKLNLRIFIVVSGKDSLAACSKFFKEINDLIGDLIEVKFVQNEGTFGSKAEIENSKDNLLAAGYKFIGFGDLGDSQSAVDLLNVIRNGDDPKSLNLAGRMNYQKTVQKIAEIIKW